MSNIKLFESRKIRSEWNETEQKWYFSVIDVVQALTEQADFQKARNYWKVLKSRLVKEGNETVTNCNRLKLVAEDGKLRETDVADAEQLLRIIQFYYPHQPRKILCFGNGKSQLNQLFIPFL